MDTQEIVISLMAERDRLAKVIDILTGGVAPKRRGRPRSTPPDWVTSNGHAKQAAPVAAATPARKKRTFTAAQRKAASLRFKKMWADKKKAAKKEAKA